MANRPFKIPKDTKGNEYFPVTTTDAIIYSDNGEKKVLTEVIKKDLKDLSSLIIDEESRVLKEEERRADELLRGGNEDLRNKNEEDRKANELIRQNSFSSNEAARQKTFNDNESARQNTFIKAESQRETAETIRQEEELKRQKAETIRQENYDKKVDRTDNAPELTAGFAGNLVGRGESTSEEIGFRPSGGLTSVNDGAARIERLRGNTLVWNQCINMTNVNAQYDATLYTLNLSNGLITVTKSEGGTTESDAIFCHFAHQFIASRKYLLVYNLKRNDGQNSSHLIGGSGIYDGTNYHSLPNVSGDYKFFSPTESFTSTLMQLIQAVTAGVALSYTLRPVIYDLTQMFGAGNEPTTIEEFNARKPLGVSDAYNEGELISTTADEIKSVGFNAWDEEWDNGLLNSSGVNMVYPSAIRSKNYIEVIPQATYIFGCPNKTGNGIAFYDTEKKIIGKPVLTEPNTAFTTPAECRYMRFDVSSSYGTTYNNDICIHLVHTGYRNGEYEPYEEFRRSLPISEIKDSEGNQLFPNGLLSAGSVYDEITATKAIKRIGMVDMGTLNWQTAEGRPSIAFVKVKGKVFGANILTARYTAVRTDFVFDESESYANMTIRGHSTNNNVYVKDDSFEADKDKITTSLNGVLLYYELAEPIEVDLPEPINMDYEVSDFGTEEVISDTPTTPLKADIIYQFNAVDRIRENSLSIEDLIKRVAALEAQNAALVQQLNATDNGETE